MKRTFLLRIAMVGVLLFGLAITNHANQLKAQTNSTSLLFTEPKGPFVSKLEASVRIDNAVIALKNLLLTLTPGTAQYEEVMNHYNYLIAVQTLFNNDKTISQAIIEGLRQVPVTSMEEYITQNGTLGTYKLQMVNLLKV